MPEFILNIQQNVVEYAIGAMVLGVFVTIIAYLHAPRAKVLVFSLPVPFTCAFLASQIPINPTHVAGMMLVTAYHWVVLWLRTRLRLPILVAIILSAGGYVATAALVRPLSPHQWLFLPIVALSLLGWIVYLWWYQPSHEAGNRTTAPWWIKLPTISTLAFFIFCLKDLLAGAVTTFPYAGVFTSYEMRRSLRTLAGQFTINVIGMQAMMVVIWSLQQLHVPAPWPLLAGWATVLTAVTTVYVLGLGQPAAIAAPDA